MTKAPRVSIVKKNKVSLESSLAHKYMYSKCRYKTYRNNLTSLLRNSELNYYSSQFEINKTDLSKSWNITKDIIGNKTRNNGNFTINGENVTDKIVVANEFNLFLSVLVSNYLVTLHVPPTHYLILMILTILFYTQCI